jgi:ceramide glucosyltransferase
LTLTLLILAWATTFLGLMGGFYALLGAFTATRFFSGATRAPSSHRLSRDSADTRAGVDGYPAVSLLKPLAGVEPGLRESLASFCRQDYPGPMQIIFGVLDPADPAIEVVRAVQADHPGLDISLVIDTELEGANLKVCNLIHIARHARHDVLVASDSDILAPPDYLTQIVAALRPRGVGLATSLYLGRARQGLWSKLSAMQINYQFLPNVLVGYGLGLAEPCMGSTIALHASVLREIGGFEAFRDHLADDYEMGRAARARGYHIALPTLLVNHGCDEKSADELLSHEVRWGRTLRLIDGAGYFGTIVTHGFPLALIGAALLDFSEVSVALVVAILLSRLILKLRIDALTGTRAGSLWLVPMRDVLSFAVFLASLTGASVTWRGRRYRVGPKGVLSHL